MSAAASRHDRILGAVAARGFATIEALALQLGVSTQTVRRDVIALDRVGRDTLAGLPGQPHGAAVCGLRQPGAAMIAEGGRLFIDVGTTAEAVARALAQRPGCMVVTNSLRAATLLAGRPGFTLHVPGGAVRGSDGSLVGAATLAAIDEFRFDLAVIGCSGFDADGAPMDFDLDKIAVKRLAIARATAAIVVADAGKHGRVALARIAAPDRFRHLVTDSPPPPRLAAALAEAGMAVLLAGPAAAAA
jgi:DeoR family glycerol-3-phosphate regulon repressor